MIGNTFIKTIGKFDIYSDIYRADQFSAYANYAMRLTHEGYNTNLSLSLMDYMGSLQKDIIKHRFNNINPALTNVNNYSLEFKLSHCKFKPKYMSNEVTVVELTSWVQEPLNDIIPVIEKASESINLPVIIGEIVPDFNTAKVSLSCAFNCAPPDLKYVKVRFSGLSVPYYFDDNGWRQDKTIEHLERKDRYTKGEIAAILEVFTKHNILDKARNKDINSSGIGQSTRLDLYFVIPSPKGLKIVGNDQVTNPSINPSILIAEESRGKWLIDQDDNIFKIPHEGITQFYDGGSRFSSWIYKEYITREEYIVHKDKLVKIEVDSYTKKRLERAIKRKL